MSFDRPTPVPAARFCPTGGISTTNVGDYLRLPNVGCVGGSWITPKAAVVEGNWQRITELAADARAIATMPG